jgi:hypothetical protein
VEVPFSTLLDTRILTSTQCFGQTMLKVAPLGRDARKRAACGGGVLSGMKFRESGSPDRPETPVAGPGRAGTSRVRWNVLVLSSTSWTALV